jgi:hypothetical protein
MERRETVKIKSGREYDHLFPRAMMGSITKKKGATVGDTIRFIPQVVNDTLFHTNKIAMQLKGKTIRDTCRNIWDFVYEHIAYRKDEEGKEQIRSPARSWADRFHGVDCDCYTTFISSILSNLKISHVLRITKYKEDHFQHIYPIVPLNDGTYITIDCVVRSFDYEEPYSEKKDTKMDLEYLNGVFDSSNKSADVSDLVGIYDDRTAMVELGRLFKRKSSEGGGGEEGGGKKKGKFKQILKKGLHLTNILNPATATIRAGILLSAKLNLMKIGERLKWAYLSDEDAKKKGLDMRNFSKLKRIKEKLEKIFYGMGGKPENLKKAILTGKGNKNHEVSGLDGMNEYTPASTILGTEMYHDELSGIHDDNGELGVVTATAIASATGVIGAIAALLKSVGSMFPKKGKEGGEGTVTDAGGEESSSIDAGSGSDSGGSEEDNNKVALKKSLEKTDANDDEKPPTFWENNKKWIKPVAIGVGGLGLVYVGYKIVTKNKPPEPKPALSGFARSKKKKRKGGKHVAIQSKIHKKEAIALL